MQRLFVVLFLLFTVAAAHAAGPLPGFRVEPIATSGGFITSLAVDSRGVLYYTTAQGDLYRLNGSQSQLVTTLPTVWEGNAGLLGVALLDDQNAVVHYTTPGRWQHVIARVDLGNGKQSDVVVMQSLAPGEGGEVSTEHHGGNLTVAPDGSIWFGIGDFGGRVPAQKPEWIAGKVWRLQPDATRTSWTSTLWASGLRNPYDLAWDPALQRVVISDNGAVGGDEIHILGQGDDAGWPEKITPSGQVSVDPVFVFPQTIAPTGLLRVNGKNPIVRRGYVSAAFVTRSLYYFPSVAMTATPEVVTILDRFEAPIIDVTDGPDGTIYFSTGSMTSKIYRLEAPRRGDCNGDGVANLEDLVALSQELEDGDEQPMVTVGGGTHRSSWGCDANADSIVSAADAEAIRAMSTTRHRSVRRR